MKKLVRILIRDIAVLAVTWPAFYVILGSFSHAAYCIIALLVIELLVGGTLDYTNMKEE